MKGMPPFAVFRADGNSDIGGGHVMRCLTLANALADRGWRCAFACCHGTTSSIRALAESAHDIREQDDADQPQFFRTAWPDGCELMVIDHYQLDVEYESQFRSWAKKIMVIDDLANRPHECDVLLDQTAKRNISDYGNLTSASCLILAGASFALLRPEFAAGRDGALSRRRAGKKPERILVSVGSTDPLNITECALEGISRARDNWQVDVVVTQSMSNLEAIHQWSGKTNVTVHMDIKNMADLMARADIAIGAPGSTSWERCCLGLPTLFVTVAENQLLISRILADSGAAQCLGAPDSGLPERIAVALGALHDRRKDVQRMAENAGAICDGRGVERTLKALNI